MAANVCRSVTLRKALQMLEHFDIENETDRLGE
jgi:hypothetical protein